MNASPRNARGLFGGVAGDGKVEKFSPPIDHPLVLTREKKLEQAHICIGGPGISQSHRLRYAAYVLNTALGGGMSSRLFQEVREKRGRVYSIYSFISSFIDSGYFGVYAGTNPEWVDEVLEVTRRRAAQSRAATASSPPNWRAQKASSRATCCSEWNRPTAA